MSLKLKILSQAVLSEVNISNFLQRNYDSYAKWFAAFRTTIPKIHVSSQFIDNVKMNVLLTKIVGRDVNEENS